MREPSDEQRKIIESALTPQSVIACAGSGKTLTAVRRLAHIRKLLGNHRGRVLLLSFSNVAVDTFRLSCRELIRSAPADCAWNRVEIATLDGFITSNVLHPHAHRTMGAKRAAFLVTGGEPFLAGFTFRPGDFPVSITKMQVGIRSGKVHFFHSFHDQIQELDTNYANGIVGRLGKTGAYTHNLGRYWCYRTLQEQPRILAALARRYPHILVDEAQDIGTLHQTIIEQLIASGSQISLIGDPNQGIYEFSGADGEFLRQYGTRPGVISHGLTCNYRSVPPVLTIANILARRSDTAERTSPSTPHGVYFTGYRKKDLDKLVDAFKTAVHTAGLKLDRSAVLCRGGELARSLSGTDSSAGQGLVRELASASLHRDKQGSYKEAFQTVAACVVGLLKNTPDGLLAEIRQTARHPHVRRLRQLIWAFTRDPGSGLPSATLQANTDWHAQLLVAIKLLLAAIEKENGYAVVDNIGLKLKKTALPCAPLLAASDLADEGNARVRVDTVHQAKGESLDAVLYVAAKDHAQELLAGVGTEVGRIGYVAVTRARDLLWLAVPENALAELKPTLLVSGFHEVGTTHTAHP